MSLLSYFEFDKYRYGALNDEAFGYFKRVIVTPAVYPRIFSYFHKFRYGIKNLSLFSKFHKFRYGIKNLSLKTCHYFHNSISLDMELKTSLFSYFHKFRNGIKYFLKYSFFQSFSNFKLNQSNQSMLFALVQSY